MSSTPMHADETPSPARHAEFLRLYTQSYRRIYGFILTLLPHPADADEVLQETSIVLWNKLDEFRPGSDFVRWACGVALRQVLRHRRSQQQLPRSLSVELLEQIADERQASEELLDRRARALQACIERLGDRDRELLRVRYEEAGNMIQAAEQLHRPANTVYKAMNRIRRSLVECINRRLATEERS